MRAIMRILLAVAFGVAGVAAVALPASAAATPVLTVKSLDGPAVQVHDDITSGLKAGTVATFGPQITCTTSSLDINVTTNPAAGGTATGSLTTMTFTNCTSTGMG